MLLPSTTLLGAWNVCAGVCRDSRLREHYFIRFLTARGSYEEQLQQQQNKAIHLIQLQHINIHQSNLVKVSQSCSPESWTGYDLVLVRCDCCRILSMSLRPGWTSRASSMMSSLWLTDQNRRLCSSMFIDVHCM